MPRDYFIAGNWKMNLGPKDAAELASAIIQKERGGNTRVMIAPSFVCLPAVQRVIEGSDVILAAQNMAVEEKGAHTGETSVLMLRELDVSMVILGHSERRHIYGESDELVNKKIKLALEHNLDVILCVGETLIEREQGRAKDICYRQLENGLEGVDSLERIIIAYEPVWAIGTGKTATPSDAQEIHEACRGKLGRLYSQSEADSVLIQYGGSVKPDNVSELMAQKDIDGALVGGAALDADSFGSILDFNI